MKQLLILMICGIGFVGCATERFGNFESNAPAGLFEGIASDTIEQLEKEYPPAQTQFSLGQAIPKTDRFGTLLVASMREKGYAVQDYNPKQSPVGRGLRFQYILDKPLANTPDIYRIKLQIDGVTMTHAYVTKNNSAASAGAWAKME